MLERVVYARSGMRLPASLCAVLLTAASLSAASSPPQIVEIDPAAITVNSGEHFITVKGHNFSLDARPLITISGPASTTTLEPSYFSTTWLQVWVPSDVLATTGRYFVKVQNPDGAVSNTRFFDIIDRPGPLLYLPQTMTHEATGPEGARVKFTVHGTTSDGLPATVTCSHQSGDLFPLGKTTLRCTATDERRGTSTTRDCIVAVVDTTPPVMTLPHDFAVEATGPDGAKVTFEATATDIVDGDDVIVNCYPPSGSTYPIGTTTVHCAAVDSSSRSAYGEFKVTVYDNLRPTLMLPDDIEVETTNDDGEIVTFTAAARDYHEREIPVTCMPESGSRFPIGTTTVACWATDDQERTGTGTFEIRVTKKAQPPQPKPILTLPADILVAASTHDGATVTFEATAKDGNGVSIAVTCTPPSGSTFPIGTTTVTCSATDELNQTTTGTFRISVTPPPPPPAPVLTLPVRIVVVAASHAGAIVTFDATAKDGEGVSIEVTCTPPSGSVFPIGTTAVSCSATDRFHQTSEGTFDVIVNLPSSVRLILPGTITVEAMSALGTIVDYVALAEDEHGAAADVTCEPASGSLFPLGRTVVQCTATSTGGQTASGSFDVHVLDSHAPALRSITATPSVLWPPNHKMADVVVTVEVSDEVDANVSVSIVEVATNEPVDADDVAITGPLTLQLRAERNGDETGRVYTIVVEAVDSAGNRDRGSVTVLVPHDGSDAAKPAKTGRRRAVGKR
jgi:HYR domain